MLPDVNRYRSISPAGSHKPNTSVPQAYYPTIRCVEPAACPSLTKGEYRYDFGDSAGMTPLMKMHTLGHNFVPEPTHAIAAAIREANKAKESGEETVLLTALCGHGHLDLAAYEAFLSGTMVDHDLSDEAVAAATAQVSVVS